MFQTVLTSLAKNSRNKHHPIRISGASSNTALSGFDNSEVFGFKVDEKCSEWEILNLITGNRDRFEFLLLEIHDVDRNVEQLKDFLRDLSGQLIRAHPHANNFETLGSNGHPRVFEITLLRRQVTQIQMIAGANCQSLAWTFRIPRIV
jgi:hypothetical protein